MVLHELHVLERRTCSVSQRHAVTCADIGVGREREDLAGTPLHKTTDFAGDDLDTPGHQLDRHNSMDASVVDDKPSNEPFVVPRDVGVFR